MNKFQVNYALVALAISFVYAAVREFLPDFPLSDEAFQAVIWYILVKLGVESKPAESSQALYDKLNGVKVKPTRKIK